MYLDYEAYPSHYYLLHFGFVPISNIHDCLLIPLPSHPSSPLLSRVLKALGYPTDDSVCLDITRFMNDKALSFFLLQEANEERLQKCIDLYEKRVIKKQKGRWEAMDVYECASGEKGNKAKQKWDEMKDELMSKLFNHLKWVESVYSTSIAADNVSKQIFQVTFSSNCTKRKISYLLHRNLPCDGVFLANI